MKDTEVEEIEIALTEPMIKLLIKQLGKSLDNLHWTVKLKLPQYKFLESVLKKCKKNKTTIVLCARECSTLCGFINTSSFLSSNKLYFEMYDIIDGKLDEWEKTHPEIN